MRIIQEPRQAGKTIAMVEWLKQTDDNVLFVMNESERRRILEQFFTEQERPSYEGRIVTANGSTRLKGRRNTVVGIDNLELVLQELLGHYVEIATVTKEEG